MTLHTPEPALTRGRRPDIELLRVMAGMGVVWYHTTLGSSDVAYAGLVVFIVLSPYFWASTSHMHTALASRVRRLLVPWAVWFAFYGLLSAVRSAPVLPEGGGFISGVLAGTSVHLWYLPFMFMCLCLLDVLARTLGGARLCYAMALLVVVMLASTAVWRPASIGAGPPWAQYAHGLVGVAFGAFLGLSDKVHKSARTALLVIIFGLTCGLAIALVKGVGVPYLLGFSAVVIVVYAQIPVPRSSLIFELARLSYGIYLIHPFFIMVLAKAKMLSAYSSPVVVYLLSWGTIVMLRRYLPRLGKIAT